MTDHDKPKIKGERSIIDCLSHCVDKRYFSFSRPEDTDDFDFYSPDGTTAIEVTYALRKDQQTFLKIAHDKNPSQREEDFIKSGNLVPITKGSRRIGSASFFELNECIDLIVDSIRNKEKKRSKREKLSDANVFELAICATQTDLIDTHFDNCVDVILKEYKETKFDRFYLITPFMVYMFSNGELAKSVKNLSFTE